MRGWLQSLYKLVLKYGKRPENLYVSIQRIQKMGGSYTDIRVRPVMMDEEMGRHLKYSPFIRDVKDKNIIVLRLSDFLNLIKESDGLDEFQIPLDEYRKFDISTGV